MLKPGAYGPWNGTVPAPFFCCQELDRRERQQQQQQQHGEEPPPVAAAAAATSVAERLLQQAMNSNLLMMQATGRDVAPTATAAMPVENIAPNAAEATPEITARAAKKRKLQERVTESLRDKEELMRGGYNVGKAATSTKDIDKRVAKLRRAIMDINERQKG